uniref:Uncharacterized protein n=1 Tax=Chromera velia CCMP2878 TaxID=1169474 RepID=A0A0G4H9G4_9ALVE|eukprot:Cvel_25308.t1-p1 / transcript=Cvel_25308.t1 / gene=Cvel_25308 / organism=Chromera_velia_CCMP2878 / gene_product=hypothetical protein / transcript_product=hypothetical protein / location=Cvel_scaffold2848:12128-13040(-) / protein_length=276 / sequence_SO=supercontig / SO=protein_coding / is_pseudo=false
MTGPKFLLPSTDGRTPFPPCHPVSQTLSSISLLIAWLEAQAQQNRPTQAPSRKQKKNKTGSDSSSSSSSNSHVEPNLAHFQQKFPDVALHTLTAGEVYPLWYDVKLRESDSEGMVKDPGGSGASGSSQPTKRWKQKEHPHLAPHPCTCRSRDWRGGHKWRCNLLKSYVTDVVLKGEESGGETSKGGTDTQKEPVERKAADDRLEQTIKEALATHDREVTEAEREAQIEKESMAHDVEGCMKSVGGWQGKVLLHLAAGKPKETMPPAPSALKDFKLA